MNKAFATCVDEVSRCDTVEIIDIRLEAAQEGGSLFKGEAWYHQTGLANCQYVFMIC